MANSSADRTQKSAADMADDKPVGDVTVYDTDDTTTPANRATTSPTTSTTRTDAYRTSEPVPTTGGGMSAMTWVLVILALAVLAYLLWQFVF